MDRQGISIERAGRLFRILQILNDGAQSRSSLLRRLRVGVRTFFRDVELLRSIGVEIESSFEGYFLRTPLAESLSLLPFPNPELTFGDVLVLMKGRSQTHRKLKQLFEQTTS